MADWAPIVSRLVEFLSLLGALNWLHVLDKARSLFYLISCSFTHIAVYALGQASTCFSGRWSTDSAVVPTWGAGGRLLRQSRNNACRQQELPGALIFAISRRTNYLLISSKKAKTANFSAASKRSVRFLWRVTCDVASGHPGTRTPRS